MTKIYAQNRLKELRKERHLTLETLAGMLDGETTASTIAKLENRKMSFSLDYLFDLARVLQVQPTDILAGSGTRVRMVPMIGTCPAGEWREAAENTDEFTPVPVHLKGQNLFALRPDGTSMDLIVPSSSEGGFIIVDPDQRELIDGRCYVVTNDQHEVTFKKFSANPLALLPCSSDPEHRPIPIGSSPFTVVGRVVYAGQDL